MSLKHALLALLLAIVHALSGLTLLLVSSWFIAACAIAGVNFNYMLPAVIIRALALLKIASGYTQMWVSHHDLLDRLAAIRLRLFNRMYNRTAISSGADTDKLNYQSHDVASVWAGWVNQNAGAILSLSFISVFVLWQLPQLSLQWLLFLIASVAIYLWLMLAGLALAYKKLTIRTQLESEIEHHFNSASLWHMQKQLTHPDSSLLYQELQKSQTKIELGITLLLSVSLIAIVAIFMNIDPGLETKPIVIVIPMAILASIDWFGRTFYSQHRMHDCIIGHRNINEQESLTELPNIPSRITTPIDSLELKKFSPLNSFSPAVSIKIKKYQSVLIAGSSGSGKSRLMQALVGLIDHQGTLFVNNVIASHQLLDDVLYTEQQPYCLAGTLRQNLLVANQALSDTHIIEVLEQLGLGYLHDLDQWLGTGGRSLSGGETKRLGVARAMLSSKSFILLDEPFEGLDGLNKMKVVEAITLLMETKTVIVASHIFPEALQFDFTINL